MKYKFVSIIIPLLILPGCWHRSNNKITEKNEPKKKVITVPTSQKELDAYAQREKLFNEELVRFSRSRDFNERNLYDFLMLIELEIKSVDYLLAGPRWNFRQAIAEKNEYLKKTTPLIKNIYKLCISMTEQETEELEQAFKTEYLRSIRTALKRCYAKVRALENILNDKGESFTYEAPRKKQPDSAPYYIPQPPVQSAPYQQPMIIQVPVPTQSVQQPTPQKDLVLKEKLKREKRQKEALEDRIEDHVNKLSKTVDHIKKYRRKKNINTSVPKTVSGQTEHVKELLEKIKQK